MTFSLEDPFIVRHVFRRKLCIFYANDRDTLVNALFLKIKILSGRKRAILVISALPPPEEFRNNLNVFWFRFCDFLKLYNQSTIIFDAVVICEHVDEILKKFIINNLQIHNNVFISLWHDQESILQLFKNNGKRFVFFSLKDNGNVVIKRFRKVVPVYLSSKIETLPNKRSSYLVEENVPFFSLEGTKCANKNSYDYPKFLPTPEDTTNEDFSISELEEDSFEKKDSDFDEYENEEALEFMPFDDEDIGGGLF